ncbi:MAG TPA: hypothetical protein DHV62_02205 [Elusimicrobia bacterium]|nr:hypothetical protein [Elusimicrobiota bacterium]
MITEEGPKVLEFNCRFGDPEAQVTLPLLNEDLVDLCLATIDKNLSDYQSLTTNHQSACSSVCVVLASGGYPGDYEKGKEIFGLEETKKMQNITVFHAGTKRLTVNGERSTLVTNGGRVLGVTGLGENIEKAIKNTYSAVEKIKFEKMHYRRDIGIKAVRKLGS